MLTVTRSLSTVKVALLHLHAFASQPGNHAPFSET